MTRWRPVHPRPGRRRLAVAAGAALVALAGSAACGGSGLPTPGTTPGGVTAGVSGGTAAPGPTTGATGSVPSEPGPGVGDELTVRRTGGIAGVDQRLTVRADGSWAYTDRTGASQRGTLSAAELDQLSRLVGDPRLAGEAARPTPAGCADAFLYQLSAGDLAVQYLDCSAATDFPVLSQIVRLLTGATPL